MYTHAHTSTYTHICTHIRKHTHTHTNTYTHTNTHHHTHTYTHSHSPAPAVMNASKGVSFREDTQGGGYNGGANMGNSGNMSSSGNGAGNGGMGGSGNGGNDGDNSSSQVTHKKRRSSFVQQNKDHIKSLEAAKALVRGGLVYSWSFSIMLYYLVPFSTPCNSIPFLVPHNTRLYHLTNIDSPVCLPACLPVLRHSTHQLSFIRLHFYRLRGKISQYTPHRNDSRQKSTRRNWPTARWC